MSLKNGAKSFCLIDIKQTDIVENFNNKLNVVRLASFITLNNLYDFLK